MTADSAACDTGKPFLSSPYLVICRHCDEAVAVRLSTGRILPFGPVSVSGDHRLIVTCTGCGRRTRIGSVREAQVDRMPDGRRQSS